MGPVHQFLQDSPQGVGSGRNPPVSLNPSPSSFKSVPFWTGGDGVVPGIDPGHYGLPLRLGAGCDGDLHLVDEPVIRQGPHPVIGDKDGFSRVSCRKLQSPGVPAFDAMLCREVIRPVLPLGRFFRYFRKERPVLELHLQGSGRSLLGHFRQPDGVRAVAGDHVGFVIDFFDVKGILKGIEPIIMNGHQLPPFHCFRAEDWDCSISLDRRSMSDRYRSTEN